MRRAANLQPGDVIRYVHDDCPLLMFISKSPFESGACYFNFLRLAFHGKYHQLTQWRLHGEWELLGHIDNWQALVKAEKPSR